VNFGAVEQAMDAAVARGVFRVVVVLVNVGGRVVFVRAAGRRTLEKTITRRCVRTRFSTSPRSPSRSRAATAMMLNVRDRRIGLDDRVTRFFTTSESTGKPM
jgi:hypothetical protein